MTNIRPFVKQKQTSVLFYLIAIFSFFLGGGGGYGSLIAFLKEKEEKKKKVTISTESVNQEQYLVLYSMC